MYVVFNRAPVLNCRPGTITFQKCGEIIISEILNDITVLLRFRDPFLSKKRIFQLLDSFYFGTKSQ